MRIPRLSERPITRTVGRVLPRADQQQGEETFDGYEDRSVMSPDLASQFRPSEDVLGKRENQRKLARQLLGYLFEPRSAPSDLDINHVPRTSMSPETISVKKKDSKEPPYVVSRAQLEHLAITGEDQYRSPGGSIWSTSVAQLRSLLPQASQ